MANKYVASNGSDTYDGTTPQFVSGTTGPWATLHYAVNWGNGAALGNASPLIAGDICYLVMHTVGASIGTGSYTDEVLLNTGGSISAPITLVGANVNGVIDGTLAIFDASGITDVFNDAFNIRKGYHVFRNIKVSGNGSNPSNGFETFIWGGSGPIGQCVFINVWVDNVGGSGFQISNNPLQVCFINCLSTNNGSMGFDTSGIIGIKGGVAYSCVSNNNKTSFTSLGLAINCISTNSTDFISGFYNQGGMVINCVSNNNFDAGIFFEDESGVVINSITEDNGGSSSLNEYGIYGGFSMSTHAILNNAFRNNTDGNTGNIRLEIGNISLTVDPLFNSTNVNIDRSSTSASQIVDAAYPSSWAELNLESPTELGAMMLRKPANIRVS